MVDGRWAVISGATKKLQRHETFIG
eukprot:COSAG01_NODE_56807_length_316_cov_0.709677_1_plen_24_part_10